MTHTDIEIAEALIDERKAIIGYLLDRAEQYSNSSGYKAFIEELVADIASIRHVECYEAGEYDDMKERIDRIMSKRAVPFT